MDNDIIFQNLKNSFDFNGKGYYNFTKLEDANVGFSVVKDLPPDLVRKLEVQDNKEYVFLIHIYVKNNDLSDPNLKRKPLIVRSDFLLKEGGKYFLEKEDFIKNKRYVPLNLRSLNDYFFDVEKNIFSKKDGQIVSANGILDEVLSLNLKSSIFLKGFYLRFKIKFYHKFLSNIFARVSDCFGILLYVATGEKYTLDVIKRYVSDKFFNDKPRTEVKNSSPEDGINIFGYKASKKSLFTYCFFHLVFFTVFYFFNYKPQYIKILFSNSFLVVMYSIFSLTIFEVGLPRLCKILIKKFTNLSIEYSMKSVKM